MRGFWSETNWRLDGDALMMPNGWRIPLKTVRQWRQDLIDGNADLPGKWSGWRIRQQWLLPPGATQRQGKIAQHVLARDIRENDWQAKEISRRQFELF